MDLGNPKWQRKWSGSDLYEAGLILNFALAEMPGYWKAFENSPYWDNGDADNGEVIAKWFVEYGPELLSRAPIKEVPTSLKNLADDEGLLPEVEEEDPRILSLHQATVWPYPIYAKLGSQYRLLDGNHRRALMKYTGFDTMPAVVLPMDAVFDAVSLFFNKNKE